jgi:Sucrase/ferredoxin-like
VIEPASSERPASSSRHHGHPHPRETLDRCALQAQLRGDSMLGTAFPASRLLLVEQPGAWGRGGLRKSDFDRATAAALETRAQAAGLRLLAIRRPGRTRQHATRRWAVADCRPGHESLRWGRYDDDADLLDLPLDGSAGVRDEALVYLVCAHSKHDTCCALRGRPVAAALAAERPGRIWECSHVGGERFAANVLVLPAGLLYGQVLPFAAPEFVETTERGEVVGALLRGRVGLKPVAQAALAFAHEHLAVRRADALRVVGVRGGRDDEATVRVRGPHGLVDVTVRIERMRGERITCAKPGPGTFLAYRPVAATAVEIP